MATQNFANDWPESASAEQEESFIPKVFRIYIALSRYPILSRMIREQMRQELFNRGVISAENFETEVYQKAIRSQKREGIRNPLYEENAHDWNQRVHIIRSQVTDFYFAYNLPYTLLRDLIRNALAEHNVEEAEQAEQAELLTFNPEVAPWDVLFSEGERFERMSPEERERVKHHLQEIIVVLTKAMISSEIEFLGMARQAFTVADLRAIHARRIGRGKIGGKAAGMLLAYKLLQAAADDIGLDPTMISIPDSYYIGADVYYESHELNGFFRFMNQKYKPQEEIINDYPRICDQYERAHLPRHIVVELRDLLKDVGPNPLIVRSSSLLEDSFGTAFAGKYDSFFLTNQGTLDENLAAIERAVLRVYASVVSPAALVYRQHMGLIDYDERMAILIQKVEGQRFGRYFFPMMAGVGFSRNPFRWSSKIRREDGLLRLVCGLGTRAVDRVANDYPRMVPLSHPMLRPETRIEQIRQYSQHLIDVLDMEANDFKTLPIQEVIGDDFPALRLVAAQDNGQYLQEFVGKPTGIDPSRLVFNFDRLLKKTDFPVVMRTLLTALQEKYRRPVDIEYAIEVTRTWPKAEFHISLLQCRPLSVHAPGVNREIPDNIRPEDKIFSAHRQVPDGIIERVRYVVYVAPRAYNTCDDIHTRLEVGRVVGRLNARLKGEAFITMGPGRWGTSNLQLGVKVTFAEIHHSRALIEIALADGSGGVPEMAYGTHFFQDLVETRTYPLALFPGDGKTVYHWDFFEKSPNLLPDLLPQDAHMAGYVRVIDVSAVSGGRLIEIIMNSEEDRALAYLKGYGEPAGARHAPPLPNPQNMD